MSLLPPNYRNKEHGVCSIVLCWQSVVLARLCSGNLRSIVIHEVLLSIICHWCWWLGVWECESARMRERSDVCGKTPQERRQDQILKILKRKVLDSCNPNSLKYWNPIFLNCEHTERVARGRGYIRVCTYMCPCVCIGINARIYIWCWIPGIYKYIRWVQTNVGGMANIYL